MMVSSLEADACVMVNGWVSGSVSHPPRYRGLSEKLLGASLSQERRGHSVPPALPWGGEHL